VRSYFVFVPKCYLHHIENISHGETNFAIAFDEEMPEDIGISGSTRSVTDNGFGATFGIGAEYFVYA
jgi:oxalate decarboxylase